MGHEFSKSGEWAMRAINALCSAEYLHCKRMSAMYARMGL